MPASAQLRHIVRFWGICDLGSLAWYIGWRVYAFQIPFVYDLTQAVHVMHSFGSPLPVILCSLSSILYLSLIYSGIFLFRYRIPGAIISYVQTPFRLAAVFPPSLFFVLWPLKYLFDTPPFVLGVSLVILSEAVKVTTVVIWHRAKKESF
mgnify:CR=1 FL=1